MFLSKGFTDYLSKPVDGKILERMIQKYLPPEKIQIIEDEENENIESEEEFINDENQEEINENESTEEKNLNIDVDLGMGYCGGMEEMYKEFIKMFCDKKSETQEKLQKAFDDEDWQNYTTFIHALKSGSLSVGGKILSEQAKALEMAGHAYLNENDTSQIEYIKENHQKAMKLYDDFVNEAIERKLF